MKKLLIAICILLAVNCASAQTGPPSTIKANNLSYTSYGVLASQLNSVASVPQYDGTIVFVRDGTSSPNCSGGGTGVWAQRVKGVWNCNSISGGGPTGGACFGNPDPYAQIQACENALPSRGGPIDARQYSGDLTAAAGVTITKPTHIYLGGNTTLSASASSFVFGDGSQGSVLECESPGGPSCGNEAPCPATGNRTAIVASPTSGNVDMITVNAANSGNQGSDITIINCSIIGTTTSVRDGIVSGSGTANLRIQNNIFSWPSVTSSNQGGGPSGWAIHVGGIVSDLSAIDHNQIYGWTKGVLVDGTGGGTGPVTITNNLSGYLAGTFIDAIVTFDTVVFGNGNFASALPTNGQTYLFGTVAGTSYTLNFFGNHANGSNLAGNTGIADLRIAGTMKACNVVSNTFNGNTFDTVAAHDPAEGVEVNGSNVVDCNISYNTFGGYSAGGIKSSASASVGEINAENNNFSQGHAGTGTLIIAGATGLQHRWNGTVPIIPSYTVANLPSCSAGVNGYLVYITDSATATVGAGVTGGGSFNVLGMCIGSGVVVVATNQGGINTMTYGVTVTPDLSKGLLQFVTVTDGVGWTLANPTNQSTAQTWTLDILNSSGGAGGVISLGTQYKSDGTLAAPANTKRKRCTVTTESAGVTSLIGSCTADM